MIKFHHSKKHIFVQNFNMNRMKDIALILTFFFTISSLSAQVSSVPQPDFVNVPCYYIEGSPKILSFSKENIGMAGKIGKALYELQGKQSKVQIKSSDYYVIIIKASEIDPSTITTLYKMTQTKKTRRALMVSNGWTSGTTDTKDIINYKLSKLGDKVYQIEPEKKLVPGEYMFIAANTPYSFSIY